GRNTSTQLDFWFVFGPTIAGVAIALFIASVGAYAKHHAKSAPDAAKSRLTRTLLLLGDASLSIYLWHTFCIDLALGVAARFALDATERAKLLCGTVPVALGISILTYRIVEAPVIALSKTPAWRSRVRSFVARVSALLQRREGRRGR